MFPNSFLTRRVYSKYTFDQLDDPSRRVDVNNNSLSIMYYNLQAYLFEAAANGHNICRGVH